METTSEPATISVALCKRCRRKPVRTQKLCRFCYRQFLKKRKLYGELSVPDFIRRFPSIWMQGKLPNGLKPAVGDETNIVLFPQAESQVQAFVIHSPKMQHLANLIGQMAQTNATVLITGETGTGKGLLAREIHERSAQRHREFVVVDCAGLSQEIVESELFGHERGAFTGATESKKGLCELAHGGTLFLDEISELPYSMQAKLLRVLEERHIRQVGGLHYRSVDIRVIAATNQNLEELVAQKRFRADLFYRLNVLELPIPPLRERPEDIPVLVEHFRRGLKKPPGFPPDVLELFGRHRWPGNVRELRNVIQRCSALSTDTVNIQHLPGHFATALASA